MKETLEENLHFADSSEISEYAVSAMNWAVGTGLMKGKSTTTINSKDNATRAEIAAVLQRFIEINNPKFSLRSESYGSLLLHTPISK